MIEFLLLYICMIQINLELEKRSMGCPGNVLVGMISPPFSILFHNSFHSPKIGVSRCKL